MKLIIKGLKNKTTKELEHFFKIFVVNSSELFFKIHKKTGHSFIIIYNKNRGFEKYKSCKSYKYF